MVDNLYSSNGPGASAPAPRFETVTPSDTANFSRVCRALWVGTTGDVAAVREDGTAVVFKNASGWMPIRCIRVNATNTTASDMVWVD